MPASYSTEGRALAQVSSQRLLANVSRRQCLSGVHCHVVNLDSDGQVAHVPMFRHQLCFCTRGCRVALKTKKDKAPSLHIHVVMSCHEGFVSVVAPTGMYSVIARCSALALWLARAHTDVNARRERPSQIQWACFIRLAPDILAPIQDAVRRFARSCPYKI